MDTLLSYFFEEPEREFHIRELARLTKKSPTTIAKYLNKYQKESLLVAQKKLHHFLFKANNKNPLFKQRKLSYNLQSIQESGLIEFLNDIYNHPEAIILFGSLRKAEDIPTSDIDLLIITPRKSTPDLSKFEKKLKRKIQLFPYSRTDLEKMKTTNKELLNNFINGIVLEGFWEVLK